VAIKTTKPHRSLPEEAHIKHYPPKKKRNDHATELKIKEKTPKPALTPHAPAFFKPFFLTMKLAPMKMLEERAKTNPLMLSDDIPLYESIQLLDPEPISVAIAPKARPPPPPPNPTLPLPLHNDNNNSSQNLELPFHTKRSHAKLKFLLLSSPSSPPSSQSHCSNLPIYTPTKHRIPISQLADLEEMRLLIKIYAKRVKRVYRERERQRVIRLFNTVLR